MKLKNEIKKWKNSLYISLAIALFFVLSFFHKWSNNFTINLHFCSHTYCMIFSIIFFGFAYFSWKNKKSYLNMVFVVLVVGIILMNMTSCVDGEIFFTDKFSIVEESSLVPLPPCLETDDGQDFITFGAIRSGVDLDDLCMGTDKLRERYCDTELTYTSVDISCSARYGAFWYCTEGECREGEIEAEEEDEEADLVENSLGLCSDGIDNDLDGSPDCSDIDCSEFCGDFEYSCQHLSPYPTCGGTCPTGSYCGVYNTGDGTLDGGWCECIPDGEISCYDSGDCTGWCDNGFDYFCVGDSFGCYCEWAFALEECTDTDGGIEPSIPGIVFYPPLSFVDYCSDEFWITEYWCTEEGLGSQGEFDCREIFGENGVCESDKFGNAYCIEAVF